MWGDRKAGDVCVERRPVRHLFHTKAMKTDKQKNTVQPVTFCSCIHSVELGLQEAAAPLPFVLGS